jgi:16S rRNA processing protein RimM
MAEQSSLEKAASETADWVVIGRLWRARGIRGELLGEFDSADPQREQKLKEVALSLNGRRQVFQVEEVWRHDGRPVFKFAGIDTMTAAELWERAEILVRPEDVAPPEDGAYSHQQLVGCRVEAIGGVVSGVVAGVVVGVGLEGGSKGSVDEVGPDEIGVVEGVEEYGGPTLLQVRAVDGREILIPFARAICQEIDVAAKVIRVRLPEGLLEL